jgi:hypothetical protein
VLTQVLAGGGAGKSQLAAFYAGQSLREGTDLVVWVDASTSAGVVTGGRPVRACVRQPAHSARPAR